jgi:hypothetical protein
MKPTVKLIILASLTTLLPGCSVYMAAHKTGVSVEDLSTCQTRTCLLEKGAVSVKTTREYEIFKAEKPTGSASRAAMHGVLDVATLGIWEVAGTPIEGSQEKGMNYFKVTYEQNDDQGKIKTIELAR